MSYYDKKQTERRGYDEDELECSCCSKTLSLGMPVIVFNTYSKNARGGYDDLVFCVRCSHQFMSSFIQDYARMIAGEELYAHPPHSTYQAKRIGDTAGNISQSLAQWVQYYNQFESL